MKAYFGPLAHPSYCVRRVAKFQNIWCGIWNAPAYRLRTLMPRWDGRELSRRLNLDLNSVVHFEKEVAGILESPFNVGNRKFRGGLDLAAGSGLDGDCECQVMILTVE